ncbi:MAG: gluconate 2-dehydrogenase subunit 3 family protein [Candidatus Omnitrophica bacterium]|nr:MAG: Gluconate 2-dehydrogenase subunit 3 precursor [Candidatus Hinthialibacteria bacterium OLB16]MCE7907618.1 gluconate 2-dehydrogenase subunit 3 family protein [Candidatus Omnitrophica bacterium COP1]MCL4734476.1 gluconate 2-dehydrogenase subunit 3 family protein [Candidatus Omnitrophota bacterium]
MSDLRFLPRRDFLKITATGLVAGSTLGCLSESEGWWFFTSEEARMCYALCDQIIPPDDFPGAGEAGVASFIDRQLYGPYSEHQKTYRLGLASLDKTSQALFQTCFPDLESHRAIELLKLLEKGDVSAELWKGQSPVRFFNLAIDHTHQGYYGSPRHGGNQEIAGYRLLGIEHPPLRSRRQSQAPILPDHNEKQG